MLRKPCQAVLAGPIGDILVVGCTALPLAQKKFNMLSRKLKRGPGKEQDVSLLQLLTIPVATLPIARWESLDLNQSCH